MAQDSELARLREAVERNALAAILAEVEGDVGALEAELRRADPAINWKAIGPPLPRPPQDGDFLAYRLAVETTRRDWLRQRHEVVAARAKRMAELRQTTAEGIGRYVPDGPCSLDVLIRAAADAQRERAFEPPMGEQREAAQLEHERQRHEAVEQAAAIRERQR